MATATTAVGVMTMNENRSSASKTTLINSPALDSAVDAHASRILRAKSPPEACFDDSLGPYITSILRCSLAGSTPPLTSGFDGCERDIEDDVPDFDSLVELLEEHCGMSGDVAKVALRNIALSVKTGVIDRVDDHDSDHRGSYGGMAASLGSLVRFDGSSSANRLGRAFRSKSIGDDADCDDVMWRSDVNVLGQMLHHTNIGNQSVGEERVNNLQDEYGSPCEEIPSFLLDEEQVPAIPQAAPMPQAAPEPGSKWHPSGNGHADRHRDNGCGEPATPLKPDKLIPGDLLGALENPMSPTAINDEEERKQYQSGASPTNVAASDILSEKRLQGGKGKKKSKSEAKDLAAALFKPSRSRSNSIMSEKSPKLKPMAGPPPGMPGTSVLSSSPGANSGMTHLFQKQMESAIQILLSMNPDLGEEAAAEAAMVSNADVNVAQYVVDGAKTARPICRHMLNNACYRSDCQFSHDVEGHTCVFWLRGRCGKGQECRFLHGYSAKLLEGIKADFLPEHLRNEEDSKGPNLPPSNTLPIQTNNLLEHNMNASISYSASHNANGTPLSFLPHQQATVHLGQTDGGFGASFAMGSAPANGHVENSFAMMASKQGNFGSMSGALAPFPGSNYVSRSDHNRAKFARIPQDLWNPHYDRNADYFHIPDPIERYEQVSTTQKRQDIIDLHFQSVKTFPVVLSAVIPEKLSSHKEVWIVTGSGHHVDQNSHQKGGGVLEKAVLSWLDSMGYTYIRGKDKNGYGGAVLLLS